MRFFLRLKLQRERDGGIYGTVIKFWKQKSRGMSHNWLKRAEKSMRSNQFPPEKGGREGGWEGERKETGSGRCIKDRGRLQQ